MLRLFFALFFAVSFAVHAQTPQVPHKMQFAGMTLSIRDDARREIQKDVDALTQSPKHHNIKVERAKTYFPLIQKIFQEEQVPDDFKYLVLQESALVGDAVSVSKAVGFWQFKDYTAIEMGLRVDKEVDERMNIVSSSRAAARYLKKNNFYFNNWIFALQSYQMGAGAVLRSEKESKSGEINLEITSKTYWYIKKYLAHKVAFEEVVKGTGQIQVLTYENKSKKSLADFAREVAVDEVELRSYNKWVKGNVIPDDKMYTIIIPVKGNAAEMKFPNAEVIVATNGARPTGKQGAATPNLATNSRKKINGIAVVVANEGESASQVAARARVDLNSFLKWNDIAITESMQHGQIYLLGNKRARAAKAYHTVVAGDNLWSVSQQYGVQLKKLNRYNRMKSGDVVKEGTTLWLSARKPKDDDKALKPTEIVQVDNGETFAWAVNPTADSLASKPIATTLPTPILDVKQKKELSTATTLQDEIKVVPAGDSTTIKPAFTTVVVPNPTSHTIQTGETLYAIAKQYNMGIMDLVNLNNLNLQESIKPGQVLKLSEPQPVEKEKIPINKPTETEHVVSSTDTLYSIARKYGVTIKDLMEWNNKKDFSLSVGEKLRIVKQ